MKTELCPECGSGKLEIAGPGGVILGGKAKVTCHGCGWKGTYSDLIDAIVPDQKELTQDQAHAIALEVAKTYMALLAKHAAQGIGLAMIEAGIIGVKDTTNLTRLIRAATAGAHTATLVEVESIQKERQGESATN